MSALDYFEGLQTRKSPKNTAISCDIISVVIRLFVTSYLTRLLQHLIIESVYGFEHFVESDMRI